LREIIFDNTPSARANIWFPWKEIETSIFLVCQGISFGDILPRFEESRFVFHTKVRKNKEVNRWQCDDLFQLKKENPIYMKEFDREKMLRN